MNIGIMEWVIIGVLCATPVVVAAIIAAITVAVARYNRRGPGNRM